MKTTVEFYDYLFTRKSVRSYDEKPLDNNLLDEIRQFANNLNPLVPGIQTHYEIVSSVRNIMPVKAPHYFIISSEQTDLSLVNVGFLWEQMDLYLYSKGLGACWLGMAKPEKEIKTDLPFAIILAFGKPAGSAYRSLDEFKRKPLAEIASGTGSVFEAVRLAPSASNSQNWFFQADGEHIHVYQKKLNPALAIMYSKFTQIDMGIALCFLCCAVQKAGRDFVFTVKEGTEKKGYTYIGTVQ